MESLNDFQTSQSQENRFPTDLELKEIKQMLLTGERNQIIQSIEKIKIFLSSEESLSEILRSDITEFLCDAVNPFDTVIVCSLYNCIELMTGHVEFFTQNHSCFVIESLMRTLHFLMKDSSSLNGLNRCLNLLNMVMRGYNSYEISPEKKTVENLIHLLPSLLKNLTPTLNNKYQIGAFILSLTEMDVMKWNQEASKIIITSFSSWFSLLIEVLESEHMMREKLILLSSTLCHSILKFLISNESSLEEFAFEIDVNLKNDVIKNVSEFLISVGAPYFDSIPLSDIANDPSSLESFYQAILWFFSEGISSDKNRLTHGLSEMGFLQFTTRIIFFTDPSHGQKLRRLCVLALFHVILYLSEEVFNFPEVWPSGRDDFRKEIQCGITQLPADSTKWLDVLISPEASLSCKLALLLYLYFYSMTARSQNMLREIYPAISSFIRLTGLEIESSILLLKVVWFLFVLSQLSIAETSHLDSEIEITNEMSSLLEAHADLSLFYTHHPALLYWAFSSNVSRKIQTQTVHLWLRHKTPDCKELDEMMKKSADVRFAVLDILQNGWGQELDSAFSSLKSLLTESQDEEDDLAASIWFLLPQVLAKFTADSISVMNVDYVIELCSLKIPQNMDITRIIRIASLLPEVLLKSDLISMVPSFTVVFHLMRIGLEMEDTRVLHVFRRHDEFVMKIMKGLHANALDVSFLSIKIITILWKKHKGMKTPEKRKKFEMSKESIFKLLETNCERVLSEGLVFLHQVLLSKFQSPLFQIKDVDAGFVEILILEVLNVCVKGSFDNSKLSWNCLKLFLSLDPVLDDVLVQDEFATSPLLHEVILLHLPQLKQTPEFKEFLTVWMDVYITIYNDPCFQRKIFGSLYSEMVERVGRQIIEDNKPEDRTLYGKILKSGFFCCKSTGKNPNVQR